MIKFNGEIILNPGSDSYRTTNIDNCSCDNIENYVTSSFWGYIKVIFDQEVHWPWLNNHPKWICKIQAGWGCGSGCGFTKHEAMRRALHQALNKDSLVPRATDEDLDQI